MPATKIVRLEARITPETRDRIDELARWWGGVRPLSLTDTMDEAVRRAWEAERRKGARKRSEGPGKSENPS